MAEIKSDTTATIKRSIKWKLMGVLTVVIVSLVAVMSFMQISAQKRIMEAELNARIALMRENMIERGKALIIILSQQIENYIACLNFSAVIAAINESVNENQEITVGILMNASGLVFAHTLHPDLIQSVLNAERDRIALRQDRLICIPYMDGNEQVVEFVNPIQISTTPWGVLRLTYTMRLLNQDIQASRKEIGREINKMIYKYLLTVALFLVGCFGFVFFLSTRFSRPIIRLTESARKLSKGDFSVSSDIQVCSRDELGVLGLAFIDMSAELKESYRKLSDSEKRFRALFEYSPIALWEEDLSRIRTHVNELDEKGIGDKKRYFEDHPEIMIACADLLQIKDVNQATIKLYEADSKDLVVNHIKEMMRAGNAGLKEQLIAFCEGRTAVLEDIHRTITGKNITVLIKAIIPPGSEKSWSKVLVSVHDLTERTRAEFLEKMFGRYLSAEVMNMLIKSPEAIRLGGEKRRVTIMMTDLRGFTAISERLDPEQVVQILNTYFEVMVDLVHQYGGTLNEIVGDSMLVIFGAPQQLNDRAHKAIACAIAMQNAMSKVNKINGSLGLPEIEMGIGINDAEVIVGNIGSKTRSKFGVVGSGVNITSRIESHSLGGQILISESICKMVGDILRIDEKMEIHAKGKEAALTLYSIGGIAGKHNLALNKESMRLLELLYEIPVRYWALSGGKYADEVSQQGVILKLSTRCAEMRLKVGIALLTDLKFNLTDVSDTLSSKDFFGKVAISCGEGKMHYRLRFTSIPPEVSAYFQAVCRYGTQMDTPTKRYTT